jgi:hypothetical protein
LTFPVLRDVVFRWVVMRNQFEQAFMQARGLLSLMPPSDAMTILVGRLKVDPFVAYMALVGAIDDLQDNCGHA